MDTFEKLYEDYQALKMRRKKSRCIIDKLKEEFDSVPEFKEKNVSVFAAGSVGRLETGSKSDLDLFIISLDERSNVDKIRAFSHILKVHEKLGYPEVSNDGQFLKVHSLEKLKNATGSPADDHENIFTTRMLLLLEGQPVCNERVYNQILKEIAAHYFRDDKGKKNFRPLFLLNDILRYWRTLCLNYEQIRHDPDRPWRKKNINLKFSRMITIFGTVLPLVTKTIQNSHQLAEFCSYPPLLRFARGVDGIKRNCQHSEFIQFLYCYEFFLSLKESDDPDVYIESKKDVEENAKLFSDFIYKMLNNESIDSDLKKYLII